MTNATMIALVIRALRAALDELERGVVEDRPAPTAPRIPSPSTRPVDEVTRARVRRTLRDRGIVRT